MSTSFLENHYPFHCLILLSLSPPLVSHCYCHRLAHSLIHLYIYIHSVYVCDVIRSVMYRSCGMEKRGCISIIEQFTINCIRVFFFCCCLTLDGFFATCLVRTWQKPIFIWRCTFTCELRITYMHIVHMLQPYVVSFEIPNKKKCSQMSMQRIPLLEMIWLYDLFAMCLLVHRAYIQFPRPQYSKILKPFYNNRYSEVFTLVLHHGARETPNSAFRGSRR